MKTIETQLRDAAKRSGLSMKKISDQSGIAYQSVHRFIARDGQIMLGGAAKMAKLLGLELRPIGDKKRKGR